LTWIEELLKDENKALKNIYRLYRTECLAWLQTKYGLEVDESVDVFQLAVIIIYDNAVMGKISAQHADAKSYLYGVARNKAYEIMRQKKSNVSIDEHPLLLSYITNEEETPINEEAISLANDALVHLGQPCQNILELYYYQNKSMDEITTIHGYKNTDTTKNQKYKCLKRLQSIYFNHMNKTKGVEK
jgi:RNA polymerase sigma factor (sigma-70 family)